MFLFYFVSESDLCKCSMPLLMRFCLFFCILNIVLSMFYASLNVFYFAFVSEAKLCQRSVPLFGSVA